MNDYQRAKISSYDLTVKVSNLSPASMAMIKNFKKGIDRLLAIIVKIYANTTEQAINITGVTRDKLTLLNLLIGQLLEVSGAVHSYAEAKGDKTLQGRVNYKLWTVEKLDQVQVVAAAEIVLAEALKITPLELEDEGISAQEMTAFSETLAQFRDTKSDNKVAVGSRRLNTEVIAQLFTEAYNLKKNTLDRLAVQFQRKDPEFYIKYKDASRVIYHQSAPTPEDPEATPTV